MFGNLINKAVGGLKSFAATTTLDSLTKSIINKNIQLYDASMNTIVVANMSMTGWESAKITDAELTKEYLGISANEAAFVKQVTVRKLSISFLPTSESFKKLEQLALVCMNFNKYFLITIIENGEWVGDYKAQFSNMDGRNLAAESENLTVEFYIIPILTKAKESIQIIEKSTDSIDDLINTLPSPDVPN